MIITTKRHPFKFYLSVAFVTIFMCGLAMIISFSISNEILQKDNPAPVEYLLLILNIVIFFLVFYLPYVYWKNAPKISIDKNSIQIGKETFQLKDIRNIELTGKKPFRLIINFPMEGAEITFHNGTEKILFDDMYSNISEVKLFLEQVVLKNQDYKPSTPTNISQDAFRLENEEIFKGNQLTSMRGISLWGLIAFITFLIIASWEKQQFAVLFFLSLFGVYWFTLFSWMMHYFGLTNNYLIIRNHNFIRRIKIYPISNIKEVVFERHGNQPNAMRVITKDFQNKLYLGGTLRDRTWLELIKQLESKGVKVRNECDFYD